MGRTLSGFIGRVQLFLQGFFGLEEVLSV